MAGREFAEVQLDFNSGEVPSIKCPITGAVVNIDQSAEPPDWENIPTVLFYFPGEGELEYVRADLKVIIEKVRMKLREEERASCTQHVRRSTMTMSTNAI